MQRMLNVVDVASRGEEHKCLTVEYNGKTVGVHLDVLEPMRALGKWLVSDSDLRELFGAGLKPHHAPMMAELCERFGANGGASPPAQVDMDKFEAALAAGNSLSAALAEQRPTR